MIKVNDLIDDRYKIKASIGHGGMSDVFEGYDIVMKRAVAFKILNEESVLNPQNLIRFEKIVLENIKNLLISNLIRNIIKL